MPRTDGPESAGAPQKGLEDERRRRSSSLPDVVRECALWTAGLTVLIGAFALSWRFVPL